MDKKALLDQYPAICKRVVELYFQNVPLEEAIEQAKKEYEGVIECQKRS